MIIFLDSTGAITSGQYESIGTGSSAAMMYIVAPIPPGSCTVSFELPNGYLTPPYLATLDTSGELPPNVYLWFFKLNEAITAYPGTVTYTVRFTMPDGSIIASNAGAFTVARGVPSLPVTPTSTVYQDILSALSSVVMSNNATQQLVSDLSDRVTNLENGGNSGGNGGGGDAGYVQVSDIMAFDWYGAIADALGVDSIPTANSNSGELMLAFADYAAYVTISGSPEYINKTTVYFTVAYAGTGTHNLTLSIIYKGKLYVYESYSEMQEDGSYQFVFTRPYISFYLPS